MTQFEMIEQDFAEVTTMLTAFVQRFDDEWAVALGSDFDCVNDHCIIHYAIAMPDEGAITFQTDFIKRFPACFDFDVFTLSFLHEVGHCETEFDMVNDIKQRNLIQKMTDKAKAFQAYYNLYNERTATDWAGNYLTAHHDEMKIWEEKILKKLKKVLDKYPD